MEARKGVVASGVGDLCVRRYGDGHAGEGEKDELLGERVVQIGGLQKQGRFREGLGAKEQRKKTVGGEGAEAEEAEQRGVGSSMGESGVEVVPGGEVKRRREQTERQHAVSVGTEGGRGEEGELGPEGGVVGEEEEVEAGRQFGEGFLTDAHLLSGNEMVVEWVRRIAVETKQLVLVPAFVHVGKSRTDNCRCCGCIDCIYVEIGSGNAYQREY